MTTYTNDNLAIISSSKIAYLAQNMIIVYNLLTNQQILHFQNSNNKQYRVLKYFPEKQWLCAGEGHTKQGEIHIFSTTNVSENFNMK